MFHFLCKSILHSKNRCFHITASNPSNVLPFSSVRFLSTSDATQHSFTVSYLMNTYELSLESALSVSKSVNFENPEKPDFVLSFFKNLGFSIAQISRMIRRFPKILSSDPEKFIFPKVEFFRSKGASTQDLIRIFNSYPWLFKRSLDNQLVPSFNFFRDLHHQSDEKTLAAIRRYPSILCHRLEADVIPNLNLLRDYGVPAANILSLVHYHPRRIGMEVDRFQKIVKEVKEMGFDPLKSHFILAIIALSGTSKLLWKRKVDVYKRWGWSDEDIHRAFGKYPWCMTISEAKIMALMDFYINKLGLESSVIKHRPLLLSLSLEKRLVPRASVFQFLSSKGLMKMDSGITKLFECTEANFIGKCINCYEEAPQLLKLYNEKLDLLKQIGDQQQGKKKTKIPMF